MEILHVCFFIGIGIIAILLLYLIFRLNTYLLKLIANSDKQRGLEYDKTFIVNILMFSIIPVFNVIIMISLLAILLRNKMQDLADEINQK